MASKNLIHATKLSLKRGDRTPVTNLFSSFGGIRETNLSAILAYLIQLNDKLPFIIFGINDIIEAVILERRSENSKDRYDIVLESGCKFHIIEVKIGAHSPQQLSRYQKSNSSVLTIGENLRQHAQTIYNPKNFKSWEQVATTLSSSKLKGRNANIFYNSLVDEFIIHLQENHLIMSSFKDIYTRDLSGPSVEAY